MSFQGDHGVPRDALSVFLWLPRGLLVRRPVRSCQQYMHLSHRGGGQTTGLGSDTMMTLVADLAAGDSASEFVAISRLVSDNGAGTKSYHTVLTAYFSMVSGLVINGLRSICNCATRTQSNGFQCIFGENQFYIGLNRRSKVSVFSAVYPVAFHGSQMLNNFRSLLLLVGVFIITV